MTYFTVLYESSDARLRHRKTRLGLEIIAEYVGKLVDLFFKTNTMFRAIGNGNVPSSISELLTARNSNYNLRGDAILKLPKVNSTKYGIKSWRYQAARLWNTIPSYLRNIDTYHSFKRGLKELDLVGLWCLISVFNLVFLV